MTRNEYLYILRKNIQSLPFDDIEEIINDVAAHFDFGLAEGKTEEEVAKHLGDPVEMAKQFTGGRRQEQTHYRPSSDNSAQRLLRFIVLAFAALILCPVIFALYIVLVVFAFVGVLFVICAVLVLVAPTLSTIIPVVVSPPLGFGTSIVLAIGFVLLGIGTTWLSVIGIRAFTHVIRKGSGIITGTIEDVR